MAEYIQVAGQGELEDGEMKAVDAAGQEVLLARIGGAYYAVSNRCPHLGARLSRGRLEGTVVTCPRHGSQFDVVDGSVVRWTDWSGFVSAVSRLVRSPRPLKVYKTSLEGDRIAVAINGRE